MQKLNGREKYAGILVLLITVLLLLMQVRENFSGYSDIIRNDKGSLIVNKQDIINSLHIYVLILLSLLGGILLFRKKRTGWIISFSLLTFFTLLAVYGLIVSIIMRLFDVSFIMIIVALTALLLALIFLLLPSAKEKFRVSKKTILPTLLLLMAIVAITFFLQ